MWAAVVTLLPAVSLGTAAGVSVQDVAGESLLRSFACFVLFAVRLVSFADALTVGALTVFRLCNSSVEHAILLWDDFAEEVFFQMWEFPACCACTDNPEEQEKW